MTEYDCKTSMTAPKTGLRVPETALHGRRVIEKNQLNARWSLSFGQSNKIAARKIGLECSKTTSQRYHNTFTFLKPVICKHLLAHSTRDFLDCSRDMWEP